MVYTFYLFLKQDTIFPGVMNMNINHLSFSYGLQKIFVDVSFSLDSKDHVALVGPNGAGKSTFFHLLLKDLEPDYGTITIHRSSRLSYLPQTLQDDLLNMDITVLEYLKTARPFTQLETKLNSLYEEASLKPKESKKILQEASKIQDLIDYYDPFHSEDELMDLLIGMNLFDKINQPLNTLSGGEKSKVAFTHLLYSKLDIILLDEPTNHLDLKTKDFVMKYLQKYHGLILIISHDLEFLNTVTNKTLVLNKNTQQITLFNGNYARYQKQMAADAISKRNLLAKQEKEEEKLKKIIAKYIRGNEKKARIAKDRQKKLARLEKEKVVLEKRSKETKFKMTIKEPGDYYPLKVEHLSFGYTEELLFKNFSLEVIRQERYLILGENGVGKSTFLKLLMNYLKPIEGTITFGKNVSVAYYAQEHESLDEEKSIIEQFYDITKDQKFLRSLLGRFLFFDDDILKKVKILSPGERSRVALAKLAILKANLLLLDEPTNHLDPETQEIIGTTFKEYPGTMLVVSHNLDFIKELKIEKILLLPSGKIVSYDEELVKAYELLITNPNLEV